MLMMHSLKHFIVWTFGANTHTHAHTHINRNYLSHLSNIYRHLYLTWTLVVSMGLALSCRDKQTLVEKGGVKKKQREEKVGGK